jgi:hypothetical protein
MGMTLLLLFGLCQLTTSLRILMSPFPGGHSHHFAHFMLAREAAARGHDVTMVSAQLALLVEGLANCDDIALCCVVLTLCRIHLLTRDCADHLE